MWRQIIELLLKNVARIAYNHWAEKKKLLFEGYLINIFLENRQGKGKFYNY